MPKILIREADFSKPGNTLVSNFSVLVAGKVSNSADGDGFDNNKVCLLKSVSDFNKHIGVVAETPEADEAIAPELYKLNPEAVSENDKYFKELTQEEFWVTYKDQVYIPDGAPSGSANGYLLKNGQKFKKATEWAESTLYCVIFTGNEGANAASASTIHFGNKIAYHLLSLGYQVYYRKIDTEASTPETVASLSTDAFWEFAKDKSIYNFRYILHGLTRDTNMANSKIAAVAKSRGDCLALLEINETNYAGKTQDAAITQIISDGLDETSDKYSAYFAPYVEYNIYKANDDYTNKFPATFHYLACAIKAQQNYREWYAVAGYTRGNSDYIINNVGCVFGDAATSKLQPRVHNANNPAKAVNLIVSLPQGYYLWGNRTAEALQAEDAGGLVFSHFLNIRQLCCTLKKQLYTTCRALTYDPNSDVLWLNFCGSIRPLLERMKADQGIKDYAFERKTTELKGKMFAAVRIIPIEAVEDFEIVATLEDNLDNPTVQIDEQLLNYTE